MKGAVGDSLFVMQGDLAPAKTDRCSIQVPLQQGSFPKPDCSESGFLGRAEGAFGVWKLAIS